MGPLVGHTMALSEFDHYKRMLILITEMRLFGGVKSEQKAMYYSRVTTEIIDLDFI